MSLKTKILDGLHQLRMLFERTDLPDVSTGSAPASEPIDRAQPSAASRGPRGVDHLGPYGPLISAIREELERFVLGDVRLHLSIASHDRYLLTAIEIADTDHGQAAQLLHGFREEFKPEQIKRFLSREVISGLPNAGAIDLSQFSGLTTAEPTGGDTHADDDYADLIAALGDATGAGSRPEFSVTLHGRWYESDAPAASEPNRTGDDARTPVAGRPVQIEIEDAAGARRVTLPSVVPGRRYTIGKGEGCDIAIDGVYASRRHCEIWLDDGRWWVGDAGSTNGIRVELGNHVLARSGAQAHGVPAAPAAIELAAGARIVLSARADGPPEAYPRLVIHAPEPASALATPLAMPAASLATPLTPIARPQRAGAVLTLTAQMTTGTQSVRLDASRLPFSVGRSRSQALVVPPAHEGVSGRHIDLVALDESGADVAVHGDNGVTIDATMHPAGSRFRWRVGEPMMLGRALPHEPSCTLTLSRAP